MCPWSILSGTSGTGLAAMTMISSWKWGPERCGSTLCLFNIAMENDPFVDGLPITMSNSQRVNVITMFYMFLSITSWCFEIWNSIYIYMFILKYCPFCLGSWWSQLTNIFRVKPPTGIGAFMGISGYIRISTNAAIGIPIDSGYSWLVGGLEHEIYCSLIIVELRTPATPVGVGGGKERGGCHLNLRTWHAEGRRPILGLCWPILRLCWPMPSVVIYSILCCEMVRTRVNTTVLVPESG